jgi:hypothetical protein
MCEPVLRAPDQVDGVEALEQQQSRRLPGENQRALQPQCEREEQVSQIAEEQEVLQAVLGPVERDPGDHPDGPADLEPEGDPHGRHCSRPLSVSLRKQAIALIAEPRGWAKIRQGRRRGAAAQCRADV